MLRRRHHRTQAQIQGTACGCFVLQAVLAAWIACLSVPATDARVIDAYHLHLALGREVLLAWAWALDVPPTLVLVPSKKRKRHRSRLGGRLERKSRERHELSDNWTEEALEKLVCIYMRFSTREQREKNIYSYERQEGLKALAMRHGATTEFSCEEIERIKAQPGYPGWYQDGQIIVEERDLKGVSGTKGRKERPGFAHLISLLEAGYLSAVYVVDISRLTRDQFGIQPGQFCELCVEQGVYLVTEGMVYDLRIELHRDLFNYQAQHAAKELRVIKDRLGGSRKAKVRRGLYAGDRVPVGYVVDTDQETGRLSRYVIYEPHARIIRIVFSKFLELRRIQAVARWCNQEDVVFPVFEPKWEFMNTRSGVSTMREVRGVGGEVAGYKILRSTVGYILENPMYIGHIYYTGELIKRRPDLAIVDEETFWAVQSILAENQPPSRGTPTSQLLAGLLHCTAHDDDEYLVYSTSTGYQCSYEQCAGLRQRRCFIIAGDVFDMSVANNCGKVWTAV